MENKNVSQQSNKQVVVAQKTGRELYLDVKEKYNQIYGENELDNLLEKVVGNNKNVASLSFTDFLLRTRNNASDFFQIVFANTNLKNQFFTRINKIATLTGFDFEYTYAYLRNVKEKDAYGKETGKKNYQLCMDMQYQDEDKIIHRLGYDYDIFYFFDGDNYDIEKAFDFEKNKINKITTWQMKNNSDKYKKLLAAAPETIKGSVNDTDIDNWYKQINFIVVMMANEKKGTTEILVISKAELQQSLKQSLSKANSIKLGVGVKRVFDIAVIHKIYNHVCLNSFTSDDFEYEAQVQNEIKDAEAVKEAEAEVKLPYQVEEQNEVQNEIKDAEQ